MGSVNGRMARSSGPPLLANSFVNFPAKTDYSRYWVLRMRAPLGDPLSFYLGRYNVRNPSYGSRYQGCHP